MASSRAKRILGIAKDTENALPIQEDAKRSKCRSTSPDAARNENTPVEHVAFKTPKATRILTPSCSTVSNRLMTPAPMRNSRIAHARLSSVNFHGIPPYGLKTLIVSEGPRPGDVASPAASSYFSHRKRRGKRTERRFSDLRIPPMSSRQFEEAQPRTAKLDLKENVRTYQEWKSQFDLGHNLLIYGLGSTVELLEGFGTSHHCQDGAVLSIKGFKGVTSKDILRSIGELYFKENIEKESSQEVLDRVRDDSRKVYLLVHSIDSESLRGKQDQLILAKLAASPNISMVASMENINASLLWNAQTASLFGWSTFAVHTCQHYFEEAADRPIALNPTKESKASDAREAEMALLVLKSFVVNAQQIFLLLAQEETMPAFRSMPLQSVSVPNTAREKSAARAKPEGVSLSDLYKKCKQRFLVSNVSVLRSHLNEFVDHELVKKQRDDKGHELYSILLEKEVAEKVIKELSISNSSNETTQP